MSPSYPFTMVIPARAMRERRPLPLVMFGHGVFGTGRDYLTGDIARVIHPLAEQAGAVVVATAPRKRFTCPMSRGAVSRTFGAWPCSSRSEST